MSRASCHQHKLQLSLQTIKHGVALCGLSHVCVAKQQAMVPHQKISLMTDPSAIPFWVYSNS